MSDVKSVNRRLLIVLCESICLQVKNFSTSDKAFMEGTLFKKIFTSPRLPKSHNPIWLSNCCHALKVTNLIAQIENGNDLLLQIRLQDKIVIGCFIWRQHAWGETIQQLRKSTKVCKYYHGKWVPITLW